MENPPDIRTDKTIVIGFTGPIDSGCTTLSKFLFNFSWEGNDGIIKFLENKNFIDKEKPNSIDRNIFDKVIDRNFNKKRELEKDGNKKDELIILQKEIEELLEKREYMNSLDYLLDENYYRNSLRISCSSLITQVSHP